MLEVPFPCDKVPASICSNPPKLRVPAGPPAVPAPTLLTIAPALFSQSLALFGAVGCEVPYQGIRTDALLSLNVPMVTDNLVGAAEVASAQVITLVTSRIEALVVPLFTPSELKLTV